MRSRTAGLLWTALCAGAVGSADVDVAVRLRCFARAGVWNRTSPSAGYLARVPAERLRAQASLNKTAANKPACPPENELGTHTWRSRHKECAPAIHSAFDGTYDHAFNGSTRVRLVLIGDSVVKQLARMLQALRVVNPYLGGLSVQLVHNSTLGVQMIPSSVEGCRNLLLAALEHAAPNGTEGEAGVRTVLAMNAGLWYLLSPMCAEDGTPLASNTVGHGRCAQRVNATVNHTHPWESEPRGLGYAMVRRILGLNLPAQLCTDAVAFTVAVRQLQARPAGFPPVLWLETMPQHFPPLGPFMPGRKAKPWQAPPPSARCLPHLSSLDPALGFATDYRNAVTTPTMLAGGLDVVPAFAALAQLGELHPYPDCTHWCHDADALVLVANALLHHVAAALRRAKS